MDKHTHNLYFAAMQIDTLIQQTSGARCGYRIMDDEYISSLPYPQLVRDNNGNPLIPGDQYMIITCANGYLYYVNITGDSVLTACAEVFQLIQNKL